MKLIIMSLVDEKIMNQMQQVWTMIYQKHPQIVQKQRETLNYKETKYGSAKSIRAVKD